MTHEFDIAWAAGFFDGEGCVQAYERGAILETKLTVFNLDPRPLKRLRELFGGTIRPDSRSGWWWSISGKDSEKFAKAILDHTSSKYDQLELYLELRETVGSRSRVKNEIRGQRTEIVAEIKRLKRPA